MNQYVLIVAGGSGQRMQSAIPKQFLELNGLPIIQHTIKNFYSYNPRIKIIVVLPEHHKNTWMDLMARHRFSIEHLLVSGGDIRFNSVKNGLNAIHEEGLVAIHDGVRPLVSHATIQRCFDEAAKYGNAIPCLPVYETVRKVQGERSAPEDRSVLRLIQTPQVFDIKLIKKAYEQPFREEFTDDAGVLEAMGESIRLVPGNRENIKITDRIDLTIAEGLLNRMNG
jgi:2-C-methyl-D-erythritol 4-phosphate cytidylyltransferase